MTAWTWTLAALGAGVLGWIGPQVIARLPASPDADPETASYRDIADVPRLSVWLAAGAVALVTIVSLGVPDHLIPAWVVVCGAGIWLAYIDWRTNLLPTRIVWPTYAVTLAVVGIEAWAMADVKILMRGMVASAIAFAVFWLVWWVGGLWRPGSFGFGDVRLAAPLGLALGSVGAWVATVGLYLGILLGGLVGLVLKLRGRRGSFALGPWMLLGAALGPLMTR